MLTIVEFFYDFVISTLVGLFGIHLITKKGLAASKLLGIYFILYALRIFAAYITTGGRLIQYPEFFLVFSPIQFLSPPVGFLFIYFILYPSSKFKWWHATLLFPFVLHLAELIPYYLGPYENKVREVQLVMKYKSLINYPGTVTFFKPKIVSLLKVISSVAYAFASLILVSRFIRSISKELYQRNRFLLSWLLAYCILSLISTLFIIAYWLGIIGFNNLRFSYADLLMHLAAFVNVGFVLYRPSLLDGITFQSLVSRLHENQRLAESYESADKLIKYEGIAERLEAYFVMNKPFLQPDLSLEFSAKAIGISAREMSRAIQYIYQLSYPDFVNSWRINYIVEQRRIDEKWKMYSQDLLAEQVGFGSRQGLHNAINKLHGITPVAFFARQDQQN